MICYDYDSNAILVNPVKTRNAADLRQSTLHLLNRLRTHGYQPTMHVMDNEASDMLKQALLKQKIKYQ